ncbi:hypothetical protein SAMN02927900_00951 [Rhizobium mongolense subsp. loessense]|uniref:Uncharacterized protein n=1 Tax=Rhizobium mongolense subsp. loessense TaxID=158890 RepID=A0A1G4PU48_9HYPH|nr:hypothetical protein [Rhizobium mongolense]SCW35549.1 hypothetical protein SAMN02927900_00951 [Rhizobium mongolense subsp. loessense]
MDQEEAAKSWKAYIDRHGPQGADQNVKIEREETRQSMLREDFRATWPIGGFAPSENGEGPASAPAVTPTIVSRATPAVGQHLQEKHDSALPAPEHETGDRVVRES